MAGLDDPFAPYGLTREQMGQAVNAFDGRGALVLPGEPAPVSANTLQALTPEEQALGAALAQEREQQALNVINADRAHPGAPPAAAPVISPSTPSLDWQPTKPAAAPQATVQGVFASGPTTPGARPHMPGMTLELPAGLLTGGGASLSRGVSVQSPLPGMQKEASFRAQEAHDMANVAQDEGDTAFDRRLGTEQQLGDVRAKTQADVAGIQQRVAGEADDHQAMIDLARQEHEAATRKTEQESREIADSIRGYEPRDRRTMGDRVAQSLAIFGGALGDAFLAAGGRQGNHAAMVMQNIKEGIQRDLDAQQEMLANNKTALVAKNDELGRMQERWGDTQTALKGAWLMKLDQADHELQGVLASGASDEAKALAQQTIDALQVERSGLERQLQLGIEEKNRSEADQLALARYKEQRAAMAGSDPLKRAERLAKIQNLMAQTGKTYQEAEKLFRENESGVPGNMSEGQRKQLGLLRGVAPAARDLEQMLAAGEAPSGSIAKSVPDIFRSSEALTKDASVSAIRDVLLRDESGASIADHERESKINSWGLNSSDPEVRREGLRRMLYEYRARMGASGESAADRIRPGAAR